MALLSQMIRSRAITGGTDASTFKWIAGRQGGRWADQHVRAAFGDRPVPSPDPAASIQALTDLHRRGIVNDAEFDELLGRLRV